MIVNCRFPKYNIFIQLLIKIESSLVNDLKITVFVKALLFTLWQKKVLYFATCSMQSAQPESADTLGT